jgi:hypothetical protein
VVRLQLAAFLLAYVVCCGVFATVVGAALSWVLDGSDPPPGAAAGSRRETRPLPAP